MKNTKTKITPTLRRALIDFTAGGRITILKPIFEGEALTTEVLDVLTCNSKKKFGYDLHHVEGLKFNATTNRFEWKCAIVAKHRGYVEVMGMVHKRSSCPPLKKTGGRDGSDYEEFDAEEFDSWEEASEWHERI